MTCVVGLIDRGMVWMAADSCGSDGTTYEIRKDPKLFLCGDLMFGCTTSWRFIQILRKHFHPPERKVGQDPEEYLIIEVVNGIRTALAANGYARKEKEGEESGGQALIGYEGRLFGLESDFQISENVAGYAAVGAGIQVALGSLWTTRAWRDPQKRMRIAIEAAAAHTIYVRPPITVLRAPK